MVKIRYKIYKHFCFNNFKTFTNCKDIIHIIIKEGLKTEDEWSPTSYNEPTDAGPCFKRSSVCLCVILNSYSQTCLPTGVIFGLKVP